MRLSAVLFALLPLLVSLSQEDPLMRADKESVSLYQRVAKTVVAIHCDVKRRGRVVSYVGSGVIISPDGEVLTALSVVPPGAENIRVALHGGTVYKARVLGYEERNTIVLLKLEGVDKPLPFAKLGSSSAVRPGSFVVAVANVYESEWREQEPACSLGVVSGFYRLRHGDGDYWGTVMEIDAALNHGSDGGPVFNLRGEVVGIMILGYSYSRWLGCAIPIDQIKFVLDDIRHGRRVLPRYGLVIDEEEEGFEEGVRLARVARKGPAYKAGLRTGDRILKVDDVVIERAEQLAKEFTIVPPGTVLTLVVKRGGRTFTTKLKVGKWVLRGKQQQEQAEVYVGFALREEKEGLFVDKIAPNSPASRAKLQVGDLILEAAGKPVKTLEQFEELLEQMRPGQILRLVVLRGKKYTLELELVLGRKKK